LQGLAHVLPAGALTAIVNTGDDFVHLGLTICPDLDTVMYTLAGVADETRGWGLEAESFRAMDLVRRYGGESWFQLGDRDLGTHLVRTEALRRGKTLSQVTGTLCLALGVPARILPMSDAPCPTLIETEEHGTLAFQEWLVKHRAEPRVTRVRSAALPDPAPGVLEALSDAEIVILGPSNPYVSIDPILSLPGVRAAVGERPVVAVSPIVRGQAVKGPLAEMLVSLDGQPASAAAVLHHYQGLLSGLVVEEGDELELRGLPVLATQTIMKGAQDRARLAREVLALAERVVS
jgi:LPPG:FO 2-phospho-L-lactate transferase